MAIPSKKAGQPDPLELIFTPELDEVCLATTKSSKKLFTALEKVFTAYPPSTVKYGAPSMPELLTRLIDIGYIPGPSEVESIDAVSVYLSMRAFMKDENQIH